MKIKVMSWFEKSFLMKMVIISIIKAFMIIVLKNSNNHLIQKASRQKILQELQCFDIINISKYGVPKNNLIFHRIT